MFYLIPFSYVFGAFRWITNILIWFAVNLAIELFWAGMELHLYGVTKPSNEDAVIGIILAFSLYANIMNSLEFRSRRLGFEIWFVKKYREGMKKANDKMEE